MPTEAHIFGLAAEFQTPEAILAAARQVRAAGYRRAETYTPFPVKGLSEAMGFAETGIPLVCFIGALLGAGGAYFMCWYANVVSYPWIVAGRPFNSWPAFLSIIVDTMIGASFFLGLLALFLLNGLPRLNHPLFNLESFARASQDRYFLCIEASDKQFDREKTQSFLLTLGPLNVYPVPR